MKLSDLLRYRSRNVLCSAFSLSVQAAAQPIPSFRLPPDYLSRFSSMELATTKDSGFGVRAFPLPTDKDLRLSLVRDRDYWEYNLSTRQQDTTMAFGVFSNGYTSATGFPKLQLTHDPANGVQYSAVLEHLSVILPLGSNDPFSSLTVGYAFSFWHDRIRVLNNIGLGYKSVTADTSPYQVTQNIIAPYTQTELSGGYNQDISQQVNLGISSTARLFAFPAQGQFQASVEFTPSIEVKFNSHLSLSASHLERFTNGDVPISELSYARDRESYVTLSYRLPSDSLVGMLRTRLTKNWSGGNTCLNNDVLFSLPWLPFLVGPSVGYEWGDTSSNVNHWLISTALDHR